MLHVHLPKNYAVETKTSSVSDKIKSLKDVFEKQIGEQRLHFLLVSYDTCAVL